MEILLVQKCFEIVDAFTKAKRSEVMSRIRSRGNKDTELALARLLRKHHIAGWRRHLYLRFTNDDLRLQRGTRNRQSAIGNRQFSVRPDFVFPKSRLAVFVDGCFWHGCPRHATQPRNNWLFWRRKLAGNKARDRRVNRALRSANWRVLRIWEHELAKANTGRLIKRLQRVLIENLS